MSGRAPDALRSSGVFVGIDVGARVHHVAVVDDRGAVLELPAAGVDLEAVVAGLEARGAVRGIAIDAPAVPAPVGLRSRPAEAHVVRALGCRIFATPPAEQVAGHWLEGFLRAGFQLHARLADHGAVEVFPTASRTVWAGRRLPGETKAAWSERVLRARAAGLGVARTLPGRWNQHQRDALTAAWTALEHAAGHAVELDGGTAPGIWVPRGRSGPRSARGDVTD